MQLPLTTTSIFLSFLWIYLMAWLKLYKIHGSVLFPLKTEDVVLSIDVSIIVIHKISFAYFYNLFFNQPTFQHVNNWFLVFTCLPSFNAFCLSKVLMAMFFFQLGIFYCSVQFYLWKSSKVVLCCSKILKHEFLI